MHSLPVRFSTQKELLDGDGLPTFRGKDPKDDREGRKRVLSIDISIESEEQPVVNVNWVHNRAKSFEKNGQQSAAVHVRAGKVCQRPAISNCPREVLESSCSAILCRKSSKKLNQTEASENIWPVPFTACISKNSLVSSDNPERTSQRIPLTAANINRLTTKRKINLSTSVDCERPPSIGEVRNLQPKQRPQQKQQKSPHYERIQDQLKNFGGGGRGYRYQQLISRGRNNQSKTYRPRQLASKQTEQAFQQGLGRLRD